MPSIIKEIHNFKFLFFQLFIWKEKFYIVEKYLHIIKERDIPKKIIKIFEIKEIYFIKLY